MEKDWRGGKRTSFWGRITSQAKEGRLRCPDKSKSCTGEESKTRWSRATDQLIYGTGRKQRLATDGSPDNPKSSSAIQDRIPAKNTKAGLWKAIRTHSIHILGDFPFGRAIHRLTVLRRSYMQKQLQRLSRPLLAYLLHTIVSSYVAINQLCKLLYNMYNTSNYSSKRSDAIPRHNMHVDQFNILCWSSERIVTS